MFCSAQADAEILHPVLGAGPGVGPPPPTPSTRPDPGKQTVRNEKNCKKKNLLISDW